MGSVERVDLTLPLNLMVFYVRKDAALRELWRKDFRSLAQRFGLSDAEYEAVKDADVKRMLAMGVHQYLVPHILRLTFGETNMTNTHPALTAYQRAFPAETKESLGGSKWDVTDKKDG